MNPAQENMKVANLCDLDRYSRRMLSAGGDPCKRKSIPPLLRIGGILQSFEIQESVFPKEIPWARCLVFDKLGITS